MSFLKYFCGGGQNSLILGYDFSILVTILLGEMGGEKSANFGLRNLWTAPYSRGIK